MGNVMIMSRRNHVDRKWTRNKHCKYLPCKIIKISLKHYHIFGSIVLTSLLSGAPRKKPFPLFKSFFPFQVHRSLREKLDSLETEERLRKIEQRLDDFFSEKIGKSREPESSTEECEESVFITRVRHLEKEKSELRTELEEAVAGRKKAEENARR